MKITVKEAVERIEIILKNTRYTKADKLAVVMAKEALEKQIPKKPTTNFERIKAMSVEELVKLLVVYDADMDCYFIYGGKGRRFYNEDNAISAQIEYLESEVQENEKCNENNC